jgi:uncharacterized membrane protein YjgN (DUF898 family)
MADFAADSATPMSAPSNSFRFEQDNGTLFLLYLKTMFLSVVTLGIYVFWGRVAITKYLYGHTSFGGRPFDYHATGKEMFTGFLKGLGIVAVIGVFFVVIAKIVPIMIAPLYIVLLLGFGFFLTPFIMIGKWRFWLSRSSWCNVCFRHHGEFNELLGIWIKGVLLTIVTLGFYSPVLQNRVQKYYTDKITFGTLPFSFDGVDREFFWIWLKGILLTMITLGIYSFWFAATINRFIFSHTTLKGRRFGSTMTGGGLFGIAIVNMVIVIFTLGFGFPIAVNRMYGYFFSTITLDANPDDLATVAGKMDAGASALASGIEDAANVVDAVSGIF